MQWGGWWMALVVFAAVAQTARNAAQRSLTRDLGTWPATLVRFLYGLPLAGLVLVLLYTLPAQAPEIAHWTGAYFGWLAMGAFFQIAATGALLLAMQQRNFAVAVTLSKTEVLQVALFGAVFLGELPTHWALAAMAIATIGVALLSLPPRQIGAKLDWRSKAAMYGLICGACFAIATVGFRGAALALNAPSALLSGAWGVFIAQCMQTLAMGAWFLWRDRSVLVRIAKAWRVSLIAGCMGSAASLAWFSAYALQSAASVRTLGMVEVVFSYLVSRRLMKEQLRRNEKWGIALMLVGIVVICTQL
jgi:drug/metabolite transporter (DMT)-like permease